MTCLRIAVAFCAINSLVSWGCFAAPVINHLEGSLVSRSQVKIVGHSFGQGPKVRLFDSFSGSPGATVPMAADIGKWSGAANSPSYVEDENDNVAALLVDGGISRQLQIDFEPVQEFFLSYRVKIPRGYHFPYAESPETFPPGSNWKLAWIMDGSRGYMGDDDICLPTWPNGTYFMLGGNDNAFQSVVGRPGTSSNWFSFLGWNRVAVHIKRGDPAPEVDAGTTWFQGVSGEFGQKQFDYSRVIFDGQDSANDNGISQWTRLNISGWHRGAANTRAIYDDVYFATGPFARARIEIGNAPIYEQATNLAVLTPDSWTEDAITATVMQGEFKLNDLVYMYIVDAGGSVSAGLPVKIGAYYPPLTKNIRIK